MEDYNFEALSQLINGESTVVTEARFGHGISDKQLADLSDALSAIRNQYVNQQFVNKKLIYLLLDLVPTLLLCSDLYEKEEGVRYMEQVYRIHELILECFEE